MSRRAYGTTTTTVFHIDQQASPTAQYITQRIVHSEWTKTCSPWINGFAYVMDVQTEKIIVKQRPKYLPR